MNNIDELRIKRDAALASGDTNRFYELAVDLFLKVETAWEELDALKKANTDLCWDGALNEAEEQIITLQNNIKQLQVCKQFKASHGSRLLDENIRLQQEILKLKGNKDGN